MWVNWEQPCTRTSLTLSSLLFFSSFSIWPLWSPSSGNIQHEASSLISKRQSGSLTTTSASLCYHLPRVHQLDTRTAAYRLYLQLIDGIQYRLPIRNTYLEWASDYYVLVQRQATFRYPVSYPLNASNPVCTYTSPCWSLSWKGDHCFECTEVWGVGSRNEDCHQQPPATDYLVRSLQSAPPSVLYHAKEKLY